MFHSKELNSKASGNFSQFISIPRNSYEFRRIQNIVYKFIGTLQNSHEFRWPRNACFLSQGGAAERGERNAGTRLEIHKMYKEILRIPLHSIGFARILDRYEFQGFTKKE